jgi:hypothetical protein
MTSRVADGLTLLEQVKIQAQVLVPVVRALRAKHGKAEADALVAEALRGWQRDLHARIAEETPGEGAAKWSGMVAAKMPALAGATEMTWEKRARDELVFRITKCAYAEFFRALDEPELGALLTCEADIHEVEAVGSGVTFERSQTLMQGGGYCDFRYRLVHGEQVVRGPEPASGSAADAAAGKGADKGA